MTKTNGKTTHDIKLIVLDIDGTLLNSNLELSERNQRVLKAAIADGVQVVLATGKTRGSGLNLIEKLGLTTPGIYLQGLTIYQPDGSIAYQKTLDPDIARRVLTFATERGFKFIAYSGTRMMIPTEEKAIIDGLMRYHEPAAEVVGPLVNQVGKVPLNKLMAIGADARAIKALRWQLEAQLGGAARLMQAGIPTMLEVLPPGASKGTALRYLLDEMLHIDPQHVLAMGDAENDAEMLQLAGVGVAIGNADEGLKQVADYVVGTNDEDGVAEAVERFVLKRKVDAPETGDAEKMIEPGSDVTHTHESAGMTGTGED